MRVSGAPSRALWKNAKSLSLAAIVCAAAVAVNAAVVPAVVSPSLPAATSAFAGFLNLPSAPMGPQPKSAPSATLPTISAADVAAVVSGNNQFAYDLYGALSAANTGNLVFSPYSISTALAMTYAARGGRRRPKWPRPCTSRSRKLSSVRPWGS